MTEWEKQIRSCVGGKKINSARLYSKEEGKELFMLYDKKVNVTMYQLNGRENNNKNCKFFVSIVHFDASYFPWTLETLLRRSSLGWHGIVEKS